MSRIKVLPQHLANQIAAGEVVERPASVIKELIENSIDAGASKISLEIELGGRRLMKISDDGVGIGRDDARLALERHATSKLSVLNDLECITTLGFRGEALASISAVSRIELISKRDDEETAVRVTNEGDVINISESAHPTGTTIAVRDLFYNTPARRKFLRSQPTENFHIASIVTHYALANPGIAFVLTNNGRESLRTATARSLKERAYQLFGKELIESLVPVSGGNGTFLKVGGFVSAPRERRTSRDSQYFFINGRFVKDKVVSSALSEGYRSVLPHGVYPVAFLFLDLPPEEVDVNVHPSKTEVRFRRAEAIKEIVATAVRESLRNAGIGRYAESPMETSEDAAPRLGADLSEGQSDKQALSATAGNMVQGESSETFTDTADLYSYADPVVDESPGTGIGVFDELDQSVEQVSNPNEAPFHGDLPEGYAFLPPVDSAYSVPREISPDELNPVKIKPIGQLHESFIIAADDEGLLLIDQHVAHERILFDYFRKRESDRSIESQNLLIPEIVDLTPAQSEALSELKEQLEAYGFRIAEMSGRTVALQSVPSDIPPGDAMNLFSEILETVSPLRKGNADSAIKDDIAATLACKAAVKINMVLTEQKMRWMIDKLLVTSSPSTCPHGRPVVLRLTLKDIERKFHRS